MPNAQSPPPDRAPIHSVRANQSDIPSALNSHGQHEGERPYDDEYKSRYSSSNDDRPNPESFYNATEDNDGQSVTPGDDDDVATRDDARALVTPRQALDDSESGHVNLPRGSTAGADVPPSRFSTFQVRHPLSIVTIDSTCLCTFVTGFMLAYVCDWFLSRHGSLHRHNPPQFPMLVSSLAEMMLSVFSLAKKL